MELFTGSYNPKTDTIEGCTYGSLIWYHERGHQQQFKQKWIFKVWEFLELSLLIGQTFVVGAFVLYFLGYDVMNLFIIGSGILIPNFVFIQLLEAHAWYYAFKHKYFTK